MGLFPFLMALYPIYRKSGQTLRNVDLDFDQAAVEAKDSAALELGEHG